MSSKVPRRYVLATAAAACAVAAATGGPAAMLCAAPLFAKRGEGRWVKTVKLAALEEGKPQRVAIVDDRHDAWSVERHVELGSVWLVRRGNDVVALSAVCPHLGCSVNAVGDGFACPCHTSAFDPGGKRTSGPAPRDLDTLATKIDEAGVVAVDFRRFRIGDASKVEA